MKPTLAKLIDFLRVRLLVEGEDSLKRWKGIMFAFILLSIIVVSTLMVEQKIHKIARTQSEVNELKSEFVDVRSRLQKERLESSLLEQLENKGLKQPSKPPQRIKVIIEE